MSYTAAHSLNNEEISRYSRQMLLPEIGVAGQEKLCSAKILVVGAGGLGCPAALYLVGAGVGTVGIIDFDIVEISNLHRQIAHATARVGMNKVTLSKPASVASFQASSFESLSQLTARQYPLRSLPVP